MNLRFDIVLLLVVEILIFILLGFLLDGAFKSRYNEKHHRYDTQFESIQTALDAKNYDEVISQCDQILSNEEVGVNDIRARSYRALAKLKLGDVSEARSQLQSLIDTYPGIKIVYAEWSDLNSAKSLAMIYENILTEYVDVTNDAVNSDLTISGILASMKLRHWITLLCTLGGSVVVYERVRKIYFGK